VEVCNGSQNEIGRIALDDDSGLVSFSAELRRDHHQMPNWASSPGYRQRPPIYQGALAKLDHVRFEVLAADPYRFLSKDCRP